MREPALQMKKTKTIINCDLSEVHSTYVYRKLKRTIEGIEEAINSPIFKERVLAFGKFADCDDDPLEVYFRIMEGAEVLDPDSDYEWDFKIIPYKSVFSRVVGYTYPSKKEIWINMKYYGQYSFTIGQMANNFTHEYTHKLGFTHSHRRNSNWPMTVPYAVGRIVGDMVWPLAAEAPAFERMGFFRRLFMRVKNIF